MVVRLPGTLALAVEHVVRADVHQLAVQFFADSGDIAGTLRVDLTAQLQVIFRCVYCSICSAVDHCVWRNLFHYTVNRSRVRDIHLLHVHSHGLDSPLRKLVHQILPQLSLRASH